MKSLVMMYLYFDGNKDIKAITPGLDTDLSNQFEFVTFPIDDVSDFLTSKKNPFDYFIKEVKKPSGLSHKIIRKESKIVYTRSLDNFLTKVEEGPLDDPVIRIRNNTMSKKISIVISQNFKTMLEGSEKDQEEVTDFLARPETIIYITKQNNPYHLLHTLKFLPRTAFDKDLYFEYDMILENVSVYTRKIANSYGYFEYQGQ